MIPLHLRLSGFLSYREPVELDFTSFDLACISGSNGAGKSSLLDAITWALFGVARRRDDAVINSRCDAAEVVIDFEYEGGAYRIQRSKKRDKSADLQFFVLALDGGWKPLTESSLRETERRIQDTLRMDYETFTNASFFLQGKADQFAQQRPSDRKRILSSILGLEVWETYRVAAYEHRKALEQEAGRVEGRLGEIDQELSEEKVRKKRLAELEGLLKTISQQRHTQEGAVENLRRLVASLEEQRRLVDSLRTRLSGARQMLDKLARQLAERQAERQTHLHEVERSAQIEAAFADWQRCQKDLEKWEQLAQGFREQDKKRSEPVTEIEAERRRLVQERQALERDEGRVRAALVEEPTYRQQLTAIEQATRLARERIEHRAELDRQMRELHQTQADAKAENPRLKAEMDDLVERIHLLEQASGACPTCGQPLTPEECQKMVVELREAGKVMGDRFRENTRLLKQYESRLRDLESEHTGLASAEKELREQMRQSDQVAGRLTAVQQLSGEWDANGAVRLAEVNRVLESEAYAPEARALLDEINEGLKALGYDAAAHDATRKAELAGRKSAEQLRQLELARAALAPLEREIAGLEAQVRTQSAEVESQQAAYDQATEKYTASSADLPDLEEAEALLMELREKENRLRMDVGAARQKVAVLKDLRARQAELIERRETLSTQVSRHKTLERAFSKDGVPALLIEQALPELESQANQILDRMSDGSMSVRFETQKEYKDKNRADLKETLDIVISDGAGTRDLEMYSGGEAFRVNFAIRLALSRVLAQRAGARLQTLVIDEGFGSQDAQGRQRLIETINLVRRDFSKILVITHMEELKDAFPTRIEVEKTPQGSSLRVV
ncbi:MAG: SMC family ATPase [Anaerolineaceae bacterium]|nr:SMC family ATPase [Anaerolineaceae bacterium]